MYYNYYPHQPYCHYHHTRCYCGQQPVYMMNENGQQMSDYVWQSNEMTRQIPIKDYGGQPFVVDIEDVTEDNKTFRTALWTGKHLQVTLMSLNIGEDIGLEVHQDTDQFLRIEEGNGLVQMGDSRESLTFERRVDDDDAVFVPAGKWHNITNTGRKPLKLYSIYAPPEHPFGTVHQTKAEAQAAE